MKKALLILALLLPIPAMATTYYVDFVGGNDANAGAPDDAGRNGAIGERE